MELLADVGRVESSFSPFGDGVSVSARLDHDLRQKYHRLRYRLGRTRWFSYVTKLNWKLVLVLLQIVLNLTEDRCTVCAKRTIGSEISLDAPDGTLMRTSLPLIQPHLLHNKVR